MVVLAGTGLASATTNPTVVALGKIRPAGGVVRLAAPYSLQGPSLISELLVVAGQRVAHGQVVARTHTHASARASVTEARAELAVRAARLALVESGLEPGEIAALAAEAEEQRANLSDAGLLLARTERLRQENIVSPQELDTARTRWLAASNRVLAATQRLAAGMEVRAVEVALARAELAAAEASAERVRLEFEQTQIRAPFAGEVLAVQAKAGELAVNGVLELGRTDSLEAVAEVYESDIRRIFMGQRAEIRGEAIDASLAGRVTEIGRQVRPNKLLNPDPAAFADNRVIEVTLQIAEPQSVAGLSGALIEVRFLP
jgi:HlyD family secretion protein